jgi:hypothetical protein
MGGGASNFNGSPEQAKRKSRVESRPKKNTFELPISSNSRQLICNANAIYINLHLRGTGEDLESFKFIRPGDKIVSLIYLNFFKSYLVLIGLECSVDCIE